MRKGECARNLPSSQDRICRETAWLQAGATLPIPRLRLATNGRCSHPSMLPSHNRPTYGIAPAARTSLVFSRCVLLARFSLLAMTLFIFYFYILLFAQLHPNERESGDDDPKRRVRNTRICFLRCCCGERCGTQVETGIVLLCNLACVLCLLAWC